MSVAGLCGMCERAQATYVCDRCGAPVCDTHYDTSVGVCTDCASEVKSGRGEDTGRGEGSDNIHR